MQVHPKIQLTALEEKETKKPARSNVYLTLTTDTAISETMKRGKLTIRLRMDSVKF